MKYVDWDQRPAVLYDNGALAMLSPGEPWVSVDAWDVRETSRSMSEEAWRERFKRFGPLEPPRSMPEKTPPASD